MLDRLIQKFIVWYLKRNNVEFEYGTFTVRMFTTKFYKNVMDTYDEFFKAEERERRIKCICSITKLECSRCNPGPCENREIVN